VTGVEHQATIGLENKKAVWTLFISDVHIFVDKL